MKFVFLILATLQFSSAALANADLDYYNQFLYQEEVDSRDPENPVVTTRYLMSEPFMEIPMPNGEKLGPRIAIVLFPDFTFKASYNEILYPKDSNGGFFPRGCVDLTGSWSVENGRLILPGIGYGERALSHGQNSVLVTFVQKIISNEAVGTSTNSSFGFSNMTKDQVKCFPF